MLKFIKSFFSKAEAPAPAEVPYKVEAAQTYESLKPSVADKAVEAVVTSVAPAKKAPAKKAPAKKTAAKKPATKKPAPKAVVKKATVSK